MADRPITDDVIERVARALYVASGGDEKHFPWPCARAAHYRHLAAVAMREGNMVENS